MLKFSPFPMLVTERLLLRGLGLADAPFIAKLRSNKVVNRFLDRPKMVDIRRAEEFIEGIRAGIEKGDSMYWAISESYSERLLGTVCLWNFDFENAVAELGYELYPDYHGKGIMQEAVSKVLEYGFETALLKKITAYTHPGNEASIKLLKHFGFKKEEQNEASDGESLYGLMNVNE